jgi:hypothetical protein
MPHSQDIGLEQLTKYFHLPINAVAKELGVRAAQLEMGGGAGSIGILRS